MRPIKPQAPVPPIELVKSKEVFYSGFGPIKIRDYPLDATVSVSYEDYEDDPELEVWREKVYVDPSFADKMLKYRKDLAEYEGALEAYKIAAKEWNSKEKERKEELRAAKAEIKRLESYEDLFHQMARVLSYRIF